MDSDFYNSPFGLGNLSQSESHCLDDAIPGADPGRKEGEMPERENWFLDPSSNPMNSKSRHEVESHKLRRPYYGTKLDKELQDAKNRARTDRRGDH